MKRIQVQKCISYDHINHIPMNYIKQEMAQLFAKELLEDNALEITNRDEIMGTIFNCDHYIMNKQQFNQLVLVLQTLKFQSSNDSFRKEIDHIFKIMQI